MGFSRQCRRRDSSGVACMVAARCMIASATLAGAIGGCMAANRHVEASRAIGMTSHGLSQPRVVQSVYGIRVDDRIIVPAPEPKPESLPGD